MDTYNYRILPSTLNGQPVYRVDTNSNRTADASDPILVQQTQEGWKPVTRLDQPIDRFNLEQDFGYWRDRELSHQEGWPWNRHQVADRPLDSQISSNGFRRLGNGLYGTSNSFELGGEITKDEQGRFYLSEKFVVYPPMRIITNQDIRNLESIRQDDRNWSVPAQSRQAC